MIYLLLYLQFVKIGALSFGGGYVAISLVQTQIVEGQGWITMKEFSDLVTIAEMTPGPLAINSATFTGYRVAGFWGSVCASLGTITPSLFIVSLLYFLYSRFKGGTIMSGVLGVMRAVVVVLIADATLKFFSLMAFNGHFTNLTQVDYLALACFCIALIALRRFKLSPILVMLSCGLVRLIAYTVFAL